MAKSFTTYLEKFTPEERDEIEAGTKQLIAEYELLGELRKNRDVTQEELAVLLDIRQASVSKLEHQDDMMIGTLKKYVEALGGKLEIRASFGEETVTLQQFSRAE